MSPSLLAAALIALPCTLSKQSAKTTLSRKPKSSKNRSGTIHLIYVPADMSKCNGSQGRPETCGYRMVLNHFDFFFCTASRKSLCVCVCVCLVGAYSQAMHSGWEHKYPGKSIILPPRSGRTICSVEKYSWPFFFLFWLVETYSLRPPCASRYD